MQRPNIGPWIEQAQGIETEDLHFSGRPGRVPSSTMCRGLASKQGGEWAPGPCCPFKAPAGAARRDGVGVTGPPATGEWERNGAWERLGGLRLGAPLAVLTSQQVTSLTATLRYKLASADRTIKPLKNWGFASH